ncbi:MAG: flap endonuclease-1 [Candidatus Thermoplasmatota archaeon]
MGVELGSLVLGEKKDISSFAERAIAIDAHNTLYQFLSIIRQPDGTPLMDNEGRITSHLSGLFYRTANLVEAEIKPVYIFDGVPPVLKSSTIEGRVKIRNKAREEWLTAIEAGDIELARMKAQQASHLTKEMVEEAKELLNYLGIPWIQAPSEGEAQASYMNKIGKVWATASQDYDSLLFGAKILIRNLTITGKRKLPRRKEYVQIFPEEIVLENLLLNLGITNEQLIEIGILIGTDYNEGIKGIGPKKALKLLKEFGSLEKIFKEKGWFIDGYEEIKRIFSQPEVTNKFEFSLKAPCFEKVKEYLCEKHNFSEDRVESALKKFPEEKKQITLDKWF